MNCFSHIYCMHLQAWSKWRTWRCVLDALRGAPAAAIATSAADTAAVSRGRVVTLASLHRFLQAKMSFHAYGSHLSAYSALFPGHSCTHSLTPHMWTLYTHTHGACTRTCTPQRRHARAPRRCGLWIDGASTRRRRSTGPDAVVGSQHRRCRCWCWCWRGIPACRGDPTI